MLIGNVELNKTYYKGEDLYSDGDIEDEILQVVKSGVDIAQLLQKEDRWPILYHLSPTRKNLLDWIDFKSGSSILEIGAGCGALTDVLCKKAGKVTSVELSLKRATILAERHKGFSNLEVMVGNLNDIKLPEKSYDYVTLIGVLEYAVWFTDATKPYLEFMKTIYNFLKPGGTLVIAIENKFGLKYWAGAREDHTAKFFDGIENYPNGGKARTFSRSELDCLIKETGYNRTDFYYPFPDYKMPKQVFSDHSLPKTGFNGSSPNYDMDRLRLFNESLAFDNIITSGEFPLFSNSFLVLCQK